MNEEVNPIVEGGQNTPAETPEVTQDNVTTAPEVTEAPESEVKAPAEKTFKQEDLDAIIQREKAKAEAKAWRRARRELGEPQQQRQPQPSDGRPDRTKFNSDEEWVEAVADWKIEQRDRVIRAHTEQQQFHALKSKVDGIYAEAEKIDGFDRDAFDSLPLTPAINAAIIGSELAPKVMAYMLENPKEVARISSLNPARQAAEVGKIEAKVSAAPPPQVSNAPNPIKPVGGNKGGSKDPSEMTDAEFAKWRQEQIKLRGS